MFKICFLFVSCVTVQWLFLDVNASSAARGKRSDDENPLQIVVEQLSQTVNSLSTELSALKSKTANLDTTVAFYAFNTDKPAATLSGSTIILDHAATNVGNAYDTTTGVFTAPVSGLYDFQASIMPSEPGHQSYARLLVNGRMVAIAVADNEHNQWDQSTVRAVVHVTANQQVRLEAYGYSNYYSASSEPYTTFLGYLIKAD